VGPLYRFGPCRGCRWLVTWVSSFLTAHKHIIGHFSAMASYATARSCTLCVSRLYRLWCCFGVLQTRLAAAHPAQQDRRLRSVPVPCRQPRRTLTARQRHRHRPAARSVTYFSVPSTLVHCHWHRIDKYLDTVLASQTATDHCRKS